jgi:hypothetical protein
MYSRMNSNHFRTPSLRCQVNSIEDQVNSIQDQVNSIRSRMNSIQRRIHSIRSQTNSTSFRLRYSVRSTARTGLASARTRRSGSAINS